MNLFTAMSLRESMKPQATNMQIKNIEFVSNFILLKAFKNMQY